MDRSITSITGINQEPEQVSRRRKTVTITERVPPGLSIEQAAAMQDLKPFLKAVADLHRLAILQELACEGGLSVLDLSERLALSQPLTSWHLLILKRARLVAPTHLGRQRIYRLNPDRLREYKELFSSILNFEF